MIRLKGIGRSRPWRHAVLSPRRSGAVMVEQMERCWIILADSWKTITASLLTVLVHARSTKTDRSVRGEVMQVAGQEDRW